MVNKIGTLAEKSLHASLKEWVGRSGDQFELPVDGYYIDIVRDDLLIEIQTGNFAAMKKKLAALLAEHDVLLLHPIAAKKWIVRERGTGEFISRRKSPKNGRPLDLFSELMRLPHLLDHPRLSLGVLMTHEEEILRDDGQGSWRRKRWSKHDRRLLEVVAEHYFDSPLDYLPLLPADLPQPFSNKQLAQSARIRLNLAQRITYTLRRCGAINMVGKDGRALLYTFVTE